MNYYYDMHIHTALSPCAENEMTPNNIISMAMIKGLSVIAITDHNSCGNVKSVIECAKKPLQELLDAGYQKVMVIPGMEVETIESVHVVCLFPTIEVAQSMSDLLYTVLPDIKNKKEIFGDQFYFDKDDNVIGEEERLLVSSTMLTLEEVLKEVKEREGIFIPAHIDRDSYSILTNLGAIPKEIDTGISEVSKNCTDITKYSYLNQKFITSSDAHRLEDISEKINFIEFKEEINCPKDFISCIQYNLK